MDDHFLQLWVIYKDVHLIELGIHVGHSEWSAVSTAYASHSFLADSANAILGWVKSPHDPLKIEAGADTGIGWMVLRFYSISNAGHTRCEIKLATRTRTNEPRPAETSRFAIELPTELGLIERFAGQCLALGRDLKGEARLIGVSE